jgi:hypothetical protein
VPCYCVDGVSSLEDKLTKDEAEVFVEITNKSFQGRDKRLMLEGTQNLKETCAQNSTSTKDQWGSTPDIKKKVKLDQK